MKMLKAIILDSTHLELKQPISAQKGILIKIYIPDEKDEDIIWKESGEKHFLESYDTQDDIYDKI